MAKHPSTSRREGSIVHEAAMAVVLAGAILASVVQIMAFSAQLSRSQRQRLTATREVANLMEQLMARSWDNLTPAAAAEVELSAACQTALPAAQLEIAVQPADDGAKQLNIAIAWQNAAGQPEAPVHLVAWKYPREEADE